MTTAYILNEIYPKLFKKDSKGKIRIWFIERGDSLYRVISGIYEGNLVTTEWRTAYATNIGRANERNNVAQAVFEIEALYKKQREGGYTEDIKKVISGARTKTFFEPMLCGKYISYRKLKFLTVYSQPKLDGMRCIARKTGLWSRGGKRIVSCPHIERTLEPLFNKAPNMILDGELYNHDFKSNFDNLISILKQQKPTKEDLEASEAYVEYHMYDAPSFTGGFENRWNAFKNMNENLYPGLKLVETTKCESEVEVDSLFEEYNEQGYEGQIIRLPGVVYEEGKRSNNLLKRKLLYEGGGGEAEYEILNIEDGKGNWAGKAKAIRFDLDGTRSFKATLKGSMAYAEVVYANAYRYIGKKATVTYQNLTPKGVPRFGVVKELRRWDL